jgi:hypothetical protein
VDKWNGTEVVVYSRDPKGITDLTLELLPGTARVLAYVLVRLRVD